MSNYAKYLLTVFISLTFIWSMSAQNSVRKIADDLFAAKKYSKALEYYNDYDKINRKSESQLRKGICEYYLGKPNLCITSMQRSLKLNKKLKEPFLYLGLSYLDLSDYLLASSYLKEYLNRMSGELQESEKNEVVNAIKRCEYGSKLKYAPAYAYIENMGTSVNTSYDEVVPKQSPNFQNKYYFSSNRDISTGGLRDSDGLKNEFTGKYYYDMFAVELVNGNWTSVYSFNALQNTSRHEMIQGFSKAGDVLFYLKRGGQEGGEIFVDTFNLDPNKRVFPRKLDSQIFGEIGDKDLNIYKDNIILFSSKRDGGYGGYDLYITEKIDDHWSNPINLGPTINSPYDEVSPFLTMGGNELYFSSNRLESLGGYDVFKSMYRDSSHSWTQPINLASPINSPRDDLGLFISFDGTQAVLSSDRINGTGGYDLYLVYWKEQIIDQLIYTEELDFTKSTDTISTIVSPAINENIEFPIDKKEFVNSPIYYDPNGELMSPPNTVTLKNLAELHKVFPNLSFDLIVHTNADNLPEFNLFFGVKRGERIKNYLIENGIPSEKININSVGNSYPLLDNQLSQTAAKNHNRIDILIKGADVKRLSIIQDLPDANDDLKSSKYANYLNSLKDLRYRIKIGETSQMMRSNALNKGIPLLIIKNENKLEYYLGDFTNYNEAKEAKSQLILEKSTQLSEITPFIEFNKVKNVNSHINKYPDLSTFIQFGQ